MSEKRNLFRHDIIIDLGWTIMQTSVTAVPIIAELPVESQPSSSPSYHASPPKV